MNQIGVQEVFRYRNFKIIRSNHLGRGSYGAVYKAKCDQLFCAAKILHPTILDPQDPGADKIMQRFEQECAFLGNIRHPNIVQYLGMARDTVTNLPVLLMELLDESLTDMLKHSQQPLPYYIQVDISYDIALAVAYLHSNGIIHRDLSSNNVLIMAKCRAKVTDFGMSKLVDTVPRTATMCPGTVVYMPPEALKESPKYTKQLDCFSEGVIMLQVCTRLWPDPGPRTKNIPFSASPTGMTEVPVLEIERRKNHIDMIDCNHELLPIAKDCLNNNEEKRPSSEELCQRLANLKKTSDYCKSIEQVKREADTVQQLQNELQIKDEQLRVKLGTIYKLSQHLDEQVQITEELEKKNQSLQRQVEQLQQQLNQQSQQGQVRRRLRQREYSLEIKRSRSSSSSLQQVHRQRLSVSAPTVLGEWKSGRKVPYKMARGAAVVDGNVAYFISWNGQTCSYNISTKTWNEFPDCPYKSSSLAVIRGFLTAIGGEKRMDPDNKLLSIVNDKGTKWVDNFPSMPTKRSDTAAVTTKHHLIVAGGYSGWNQLDTVEVLDIQSLVWVTAASLPHPYNQASATICGDYLYMLGGFDKDATVWWPARGTQSVLACSTAMLLQSCTETPSDSVWHNIANVPVYHSTCVAINGELMAFGGENAGNKITSAIYKYSLTTDTWDIVSNMQNARERCLVAVLPNEIMVVGGSVDVIMMTDLVEVCKNTMAL